MSDTQTPNRSPLPATNTYTNGKPRQVAIFSRAADPEKRIFAYYSRVDANVVNDFILRMRISPADIRIAVDLDARGWLMWSHLLTIQEFISWQLEIAIATYGEGLLDSIIPSEDLTGEILKKVLDEHPVRINGTADMKTFSHAAPPASHAKAKTKLMNRPTVAELLREVSDYEGRLVAVIDRGEWKAALIRYPEIDPIEVGYDVYISDQGSEWIHIWNGDAEPGTSAESKVSTLLNLVTEHSALNDKPPPQTPGPGAGRSRA